MVPLRAIQTEMLVVNVKIQQRNVKIAAMSVILIHVQMVVGEQVQSVRTVIPAKIVQPVAHARIQRRDVIQNLLVLQIQNRRVQVVHGVLKPIVQPVFPMLWARVQIRQAVVRLNVNQVIANPDLLA